MVQIADGVVSSNGASDKIAVCALHAGNCLSA